MITATTLIIAISIISLAFGSKILNIIELKEALFKYIFVSTKESKNYKVSMHGYMVSKKNILYTLKKKYNIYSGNLIKGVTQYINRHVKKTKRMEKVVEILNNDRLESLIRLRNESPVGHGFKGISKEEIEKIISIKSDEIQDNNNNDSTIYVVFTEKNKVVYQLFGDAQNLGFSFDLGKYKKVKRISCDNCDFSVQNKDGENIYKLIEK